MKFIGNALILVFLLPLQRYHHCQMGASFGFRIEPVGLPGSPGD